MTKYFGTFFCVNVRNAWAIIGLRKYKYEGTESYLLQDMAAGEAGGTVVWLIEGSGNYTSVKRNAIYIGNVSNCSVLPSL